MRPERDIQKAIMQYLGAKGCWVMRMNSGKVIGSHKGRSWAIKLHDKGTADLMCFKDYDQAPIWIETKTDSTDLSFEQQFFKGLAKKWGHRYIVARSIEDLQREGL